MRWDKFRRSEVWLLRILACVLIFYGVASTPSLATESPVRAVVADFDNVDTSGESGARGDAHAARVASFSGLLRADLAAQKKFKFVHMTCPHEPCSAGTMPADKLIEAARQAGARLLIYGGLHKESTLIAWGKIEAVDLETKKLVLNRTFSFRGDTDQAFRRAAAFVARYLEGLKFDR